MLEAGSEITTVGADATHLTLILTGRVKVLRAQGRNKPLMLVSEAGPGDIIGERSLAEAAPSLVSTRAITACAVLQLPREAYRSMSLGDRYAARTST